MRHYTYQRPAARDARREGRSGERDPGPDDCRQPWPLVLGPWVQWEVRPYRRNVRQWWVVDQATGEPLRDAAGCVARFGVDALLVEAGKRVPKNYLGRRNLQ